MQELSSAANPSTTKRIRVLLQNLRDVTIHCLQLVKDEDLDELSYWLIRRRAFMDEIDDLQSSTRKVMSHLQETDPSDPDRVCVQDVLCVIETLDHELKRAVTDLRDHYQSDFKRSHEETKRLNANAMPINGRLLDLIG